MNVDDRRLLDTAADAVADGRPFDWAAAEADGALSPSGVAILGKLRLIALISALNQAMRGGLPLRGATDESDVHHRA